MVSDCSVHDLPTMAERAWWKDIVKKLTHGCQEVEEKRENDADIQMQNILFRLYPVTSSTQAPPPNSTYSYEYSTP